MLEGAVQSRILTLVFADLADSTALKTQHGDQAVAVLVTRHRMHVTQLAGTGDGRIIDWAGDGCFLSFESPTAAVEFALRLQQVHSAEPDLPGLRMGIHMGEVSESVGPGGDFAHPRVEGLAVDLAARVAGLARTAQVLMSAAVANSARPRIDSRQIPHAIRWQVYGNYMLKGFDEPLEIREVGLEGLASFLAPAASAKAAPVAQQRSAPQLRPTMLLAVAAVTVLCAVLAGRLWLSVPRTAAVSKAAGAPQAVGKLAKAADFGSRPAIAVLPFENLSTDPEQAFFAEGLAEDLITRLSSWRAFPVIARNSSFHYRDGNLDLKRVSAELGARYVVEGSVRRAGDRIRIAAQLIDATTAEHVWAETYDRAITDLFTVQDEISSTIAASLMGDLTRAEGERAHQRGTENLQAWSLYQLGLQRADRYTLEDFAAARRLFEQAVALDPRFATALAQLAIVIVSEVLLTHSSGNKSKMVAAAMASARRAVEIDARDPAAHAALGAA